MIGVDKPDEVFPKPGVDADHSDLWFTAPVLEPKEPYRLGILLSGSPGVDEAQFKKALALLQVFADF